MMRRKASCCSAFWAAGVVAVEPANSTCSSRRVISREPTVATTWPVGVLGEDEEPKLQPLSSKRAPRARGAIVRECRTTIPFEVRHGITIKDFQYKLSGLTVGYPINQIGFFPGGRMHLLYENRESSPPALSRPQ